jgi:23S rRNA (cytosine1962-C5)-methyltransferase
MSADRPELILSPAARKRRARLHPWIFSNEVEAAPQTEPGTLVRIRYASGSECWTGYYNPSSLIAARILADGDIPIDEAWLGRRLRDALDYRQKLGVSRNAMRLVHGEGDGLPGLVVDRYSDVLVAQSLTAGMDRLLPIVVSVLQELVQPASIIGRCDAEVRSREGLEAWNQILAGETPGQTLVECHGTRFAVDVCHGQKTGLFLDQMENIEALARYAEGGTALDLCCYTGAFSLSLARAGAHAVHGIDAANDAILRAQANAALNGVEGRVTFEVNDAFDAVRKLCEEKTRYDVVNLDPPAFAKRKKDVDNALRGYRELNRRAIKLVRAGGILCTSTCSHHISRELFLEMLILAARDSGRLAKVVEVRGQASDHPPLLAAPETSYLTCVLLQVS